MDETEIDLFAIGGKVKEYFAEECKYKVEPFTYGEYHKTRVRLTPPKEKASFFYAMFSRSGFDENVLTEFLSRICLTRQDNEKAKVYPLAFSFILI